jgi:hypothetical protein
MAWSAYQLIPIDFGWELLQTAQEVAAKLAASEAEAVIDGQPGSTGVSTAKFFEDLTEARRLAKAKGWEGDFRHGHEPHVFWLPGELEFSYAFVWKQDNNGGTFVISPVPLPWLDDVS